MSTSARIRYPPQKKTDATWYMLNCINEWAIDFHFDGRRFWSTQGSGAHHHYSSRCRRFGSFFIHGDEGFVEDIGDVKVIIRLARRHFIEIRATSRNIECAFHSKRLKIFREGNCRRLKLEFWQMQIDILGFESRALCQNFCGELRFQRMQTIYFVGKKNEKLEIVANIRKADCSEALALEVTKSRGFSHHRNIYRAAAADVE